MSKLKNSIVDQSLKITFQSLLLLFATIVFSEQLTYAAPSDTMPIWRAQVRFVTANVDNGNTDDTVKIALNVNNQTLLDSELNDFERGTDHTYDLRLDGISQLSDLDYFRISKSGSDGWAIQEMFLIINGRTIYHQSFAPLLRLDNENGYSTVYFIDDYFMRPRSEWVNYVSPTRPSVIPVNDMRSRLESLLGDQVDTTGSMSVQPTAVTLHTLNANTWRGRFHVVGEGILWPFSHPSINTNFDLRVGCSSGRTTFSVANVSVDEDWGVEWRGNSMSYFTSNDLTPRLNQMMKNFSFGQCFTVGFVLSPNGDLNFNSIYAPPGGGVLGLAQRPANTVPLALSVSTDDEIPSFTSAALKTTVKSGLNENAEAEVSFDLPRQIVPDGMMIEARTVHQETTKKGSNETARQITGQFTRSEDGRSVVSFRDRLAAGTDTEYIVHLIFGSDTNEFGQIITQVALTGTATGTKQPPLQAVSSFDFGSDIISSRGTFVQRVAELTFDTPKKANP